MKLKGIILAVILLLASIMMPFDVYAAVQSTIVPTFSSSTSQWNGHLHITNFSDGTNNQASSTLAFTLDDDYYGVIYFDGYGPSNQHIANYAAVFVAGGYGEYRYSYYQNGIINITNVTVNIVSVVKPQTTVDLTQIITLLTAIENDTSSIDNVLDTTLAQIRLVLAELIESNNYLELINKIRSYDIPFESLLINTYFNSYHDPEDIYLSGVYDFKFPIYKMNGRSFRLYGNAGHQYKMIVLAKSSTVSSFNNSFSISPNSGMSLISALYSGNTYFFRQSYLYLMTFTFNCTSSNNYYFDYIGSDTSYYIVPIYYGDVNNKNISTDFALRFGLSNTLLDDLHIIANGTSQSNSAASDLESGNDQMADDMNDLATIENGYNQQLNNQLQQIDFSSPLQSNAGILPAANFVITIFNGLINNNPFSVLIIIVCILLIGKKVIGK